MPTPLFPVAKPSTLSPEDAVKALDACCHVVEWKDAFVLVHASPSGVLKITEIGLEVYHSKRGGEYYAVKVGMAAKKVDTMPAPAPKPVVPPISRPGGTVLSIRGTDYRVLETRPKRSQDLRRFEVTKDDGSSDKPYVVSFQAGGQAACSCPDWIYRRKQCKHIVGIQGAMASTASQAA